MAQVSVNNDRKYCFQVYIKEFKINGASKTFVPFWLDSKEDIDDDPYTSDCSEPTSTDNTHAYSQFTIIDGELKEKECIIKPAGKFD